MFSGNVQKIFDEIMSDKENEKFTKAGIEPLFSAPENARVMIVGQAPGIKAQEAGKYWFDKSGDRLREWMGVDEKTFYESDIFAIVPMDFYYPGKGKSGDLPPRKDFAAKWHPKILKELSKVELIILIGQYAQKYYLGDKEKSNLTETVKAYNEYLPKYLPIVHPSPRNMIWLKKNPWFEEDVIPILKNKIKEYLKQ
ncbi:uracil-DNA glycosylase family protein [Lachnoanaerobaculum sp. ICM7]|jgi:hypothetical protein|uniref:uracil-DNA glycosylase family protein n=1 Tax=Lachnoanaerobaculum sp. ICM7 TaxID=936594 RepID=UPI00027A63DE|nr:uracil-DNA glycosylase family protein [Lachnoanaerobaculum sp. ICM7]EJP25260.1 uracil-DNA glycosylase family protein [Lachnoanaerobaculum sp. ICM7]